MKTLEEELEKAKITRAKFYSDHKDEENKHSAVWYKNNKERKKVQNALRYEKHRIPTPEKPRRGVEHGKIVEHILYRRGTQDYQHFELYWKDTNRVEAVEGEPRYKELLSTVLQKNR